MSSGCLANADMWCSSEFVIYCLLIQTYLEYFLTVGLLSPVLTTLVVISLSLSSISSSLLFFFPFLLARLFVHRQNWWCIHCICRNCRNYLFCLWVCVGTHNRVLTLVEQEKIQCDSIYMLEEIAQSKYFALNIL